MAGEKGAFETEEFLYRISTSDEWEDLQRNGATFGGDIDKSTACIHLSTLHQVPSTLQNFFMNVKGDLYLLQVAAAKLGNGLVYEAVGDTEVFPHFYGPSMYINETPISAPPKRVVRGSYIDLAIPAAQGVHEQNGVGSTGLSDAGLDDVGDSFKKIEKLSLISCSNITDVGLSSIAGKSKFLKSLHVEDCNVGDTGLAAVGKYCTQLEDLNLSSLHGLTDTRLTLLAIGCGKTLKSLEIGACPKITDASLAAVGLYCKFLEKLWLHSGFIREKGLLAVAKGCPQLKSLSIQRQSLAEEALQAVGKFCQSLEILSLCSLRNVTDKSLCSIVEGCKNLKNLRIVDCQFLQDMELGSIDVGCLELMHFEVSGCRNIGTDILQSIINACTRLSELALHSQKIEDDALCKIGVGCKDLQSLHLTRYFRFGDESVSGMARACRNLTKLYISRCPRVGTKGIISVGQFCRSLTDLTLEMCNEVGDLALISIGQCCPLIRLNVNGCARVGDAGIIAIARGCPRLSYLNVGDLKNLGDKAMEAVGEGCPLLRDLSLSLCLRITDVGLGYIAKKCKLLESCDVSFCHGITDAGIASVITSCPKIKRVLVELEESKVSPWTRVVAGATLSYISADGDRRPSFKSYQYLW